MMPLCGNLISWKDICINAGGVGVNMSCHQDNGFTLRKYVKRRSPKLTNSCENTLWSSHLVSKDGFMTVECCSIGKYCEVQMLVGLQYIVRPHTSHQGEMRDSQRVVRHQRHMRLMVSFLVPRTIM